MKKLFLASLGLGAGVYVAFLVDQHLWLRRMNRMTAEAGFDARRTQG